MCRGGGHARAILELFFTHLKISCSEQREAFLRTSGECSSESNRDSTVGVRGGGQQMSCYVAMSGLGQDIIMVKHMIG